MRVLTVDEHPLVRAGLRHVLAQLGEIELHEAGDLHGALIAVATAMPALILVDHFLSDAMGYETLRALREAAPEAAVVVLTDERGPLAAELLQLGARGLVSKASSSEVLIAALQLVIAGGTYVPPDVLSPPAPPSGCPLDPRQLAVLGLLAEGTPNRDIASQLRVSESTVRAELTQIFRFLEVENRTQAVVRAIRRGWIRPT